jgi:hypothetical protein
MSTAFVLGNGKSRVGLNLSAMQKHGPIYGCNNLYKDFTPYCLVATDGPIGRHIQESGYALENRFHTRRVIQGSGAKFLSKEYKGFSSGPNALALACLDHHDLIYIVGMDLGTSNGQFNNVYADQQFYKKSIDPPTFPGNWIRQVRTICENFPHVHFIRVEGIESAHVPQLLEIKNLKIISKDKFQETLNIQ